MNIFYAGLGLGMIATLSACGGSGVPVEVDDFDSTTATAIEVKALLQDAGDNSVDQVTGSYDPTTNTLTIDGTTYTAANAGTLTGDMSYVATVDGAGDHQLIYLPTATADVPVGEATYDGRAQFIVIVAAGPDAGTYSGEMDVTLQVDVGPQTNTASVTLDGLTDTDATIFNPSNPTSPAYTTTGSEQIAFGNLTISGNSFASGSTTTATVEGFGSANASLDTSSSTIGVTGGFAGPAAQEAAGVGTIDGASGVVLVTFAGN